MDAWLMLLVWLSCCQTAGAQAPVLSPSRSQFHEYESVSISCQPLGAGDWTVWRDTGKDVSPCGSAWGEQTAALCSVSILKPAFGGAYWCQNRYGDVSAAVNVTVTNVGDQPVLVSPVHPVAEGDDVTLSCEPIGPASFFKDGSLLSREPSSQLTLHRVSKTNEGGYHCELGGKNSSTSWLLIRDIPTPVSLTVSPDATQVPEYGDFSLSCSGNATSWGWTVRRFPAKESCGATWGERTASGCAVQTAKKADSALYWCESPSRQRSNAINISVYVSSETPVLLQSPALPVASGSRVTLVCLKDKRSDSPSEFFKNGSLIHTEPMGHMTLDPASPSDEGSYSCSISGGGVSPSSRLLVRGQRSL